MDRKFAQNLTEKLGKMTERDILFTETDGAYFAALSPDRINVIEWFPFKKEQRVLQVGAEYGAFSPLAAGTASWDIYDSDEAALQIAGARRLPADAASRISCLMVFPQKKYDVLFFAQWPGTERAAEYIRRTDPDTVLVLAENAGALKFAAGAAKDPEKQYATAEELKRLMQTVSGNAAQTGVHNAPPQDSGSPDAVTPDAAAVWKCRLYYPLPGILTAKDLRSDVLPPGPGDFRGAAVSYTEERLIACDEEALYDALAARAPSSVRQFVPGFVSVYIKQGGRADMTADGADRNCTAEKTESLPDHIRYNRSRRPETQIRTELYAGEKVVKSALTPEADEHIRKFKERYELLKDKLPGDMKIQAPRFTVNRSGRAAAVFPFIGGRSLGHDLAEKISAGRAPVKEMEEALSRMLWTPAASGTGGSGKAAQDADIPGTACGQYNLDLLFDNILQENGTLVVTDYEWVSETPLDPRFVRYRTLRYFYEDNAQSLTAYRNLAQYLKEFGFSKEEQAEFEHMEEEFQLKVHGSDKSSLEERFCKKPGSVTKIREDARLQYADEIAELKTILSREREVERLSQQHISNLEAIRKEEEAEIARLREEAVYLKKHVSLLTKAKRKLIAKLDAWAPADSDRRLVIRYIRGTVCHPSVYIKKYLTAEGRNSIRGSFAVRGEFFEGGILELPKPAKGQKPLVSIIIPAFNQVAYTYACLRSVIAYTDAASIPYEVILADDASKDATAQITDWVRNLKVARTAGNLGFLRNCNHAAAQAEGRYLFFLNNDTRVTEGWLSSLLSLMERDESIGMCGSKLVYPDGKLQEAGGIIFSDGSGWNYGRTDDPRKYLYNYVKDVDYISGAAILIRTQLWKEIGGFDERYAPAYCEDSDLAFEVRRHGKRVVYQPDSVVIHYEGVSNGTDVNGTGLKHCQLVNQEKFREKWAEELKKQSVNTGNPNPFAARERSQGKKTILVIDHYVPRRDQDAGSKTTFQYLKMFLQKGYNVKFLGDDFRCEQPYTHELEQMGIEVLYGNEIRCGIYSWLETNRDFIGIAYLNRPHIAAKYIEFLKDNTRIRCIFYGHDLHYLRLRREFELTGDIVKKRESDRWKSQEFHVMEKADMVYYPSQDEIDEIRGLRPEIPAKAITAYIYDKEDSGQGKNLSGSAPEQGKTAEGSGLHKYFDADTEGLLFVGGFKHPPNADGVLWFASEIWPKIHEALPEAHFFVAGSGPTEEVEALNGKDNIEVLGFVTDERLEQLYRTTRMTVVPLRFGAGVKGKVVEALDKDCVIVSTSVGAEGIPEAETAMAVADDPEHFAEEVIRLYNDAAARKKLRAAASPLIRRHYSTEAAWSVIKEDFS